MIRLSICRQRISLRGCSPSQIRRSHPGAREPDKPPDPTLQPYDTLPGDWRNNWISVYTFWKNGGVRNMHRHMLRSFNKYGAIYREKIGYHNSVNIINPEDAAILFRSEGLFPERMKVRPWVAYRDHRKEKYGVLLKSGEEWRRDRLVLNKALMSPQIIQKFVPLLNDVVLDFVSTVYKQIEKTGKGSWTVDLSNDLFKFALESVCHVLYGERLGLLKGHHNPASQKFIDSVTLMFQSTSPMLYIPPGLLKSIKAKVWQDHVAAWDTIFAHANTYIQKTYKQFHLGSKNDKEYSGVLADLLLQGMMPLDDIKASITELMAGGVDTTSMTLLWTMYELAKYPNVQENLRSEIIEANQKTQGDLLQMLKSVPLLRATLKETLRLHPVAVTLQRYTFEDIVLQNYHIPFGTLVQVGLYAMGRNTEIFCKPERYNPERWLNQESNYFKTLGFGFGPRQCVGRRIAEAEMLLFLIHMLQNFKVETNRLVEVRTTFDLILIPDRPIMLILKPIK
ncbi:cholesterol side-chain cleavage enzyme, mitochondrial-like [Scyliorhinus canicula]|uniref:cholesterol side-chain cleavage enzyme, mitochondrial-like n=1 Tax=Scyliorhinus canicula TaxID=7830 RepID=UPI0018F77827|nr:cholesterol side-chain cleavage enzyme, mitochondrial-like [Scyliorhinus canicula]